MTDRAAALNALADRVEREGPSAELDAAILLARGYIAFDKQASWDAPIPLDQYALMTVKHWSLQPTRNIAAATTLVPEGWFWGVDSGPRCYSTLNEDKPEGRHASGSGNTAAAALTAAALRALAQEMET